MTRMMWKKYLIVAIFVFIYPVIEGKRKKSDAKPQSTVCRRTNPKDFQYCTKSCSSDSDCRSNQKCLCDGDCGLSCVRNNLQCEAPPKAKNSRQTISNGRSFNSVVTYTCNSPFKRRGSAKRTCRAIGRWDGKKTRCKITCKEPPDISFGNKRVEGLQAGKFIQFWCYDSFTLVGSARITCLNTGQWSAPPPKCQAPQCDQPVIPEGVELLGYRNKMPKKFKFNARVFVKCKDGYFKSGLGMLTCSKDNKWKGDIKSSCTRKSCGKPQPEDILHGRMEGQKYSFKDKVEYVCDKGHKLKGPAFRICQANQKWGGSQPICEAVKCGPLNKPDHGDIIEQVALTFGKRIVFECTGKGYEMKGSRVRTCQSDGTWSGSPTTCELVQCDDPGKPRNGKGDVNKGFVYGGSVKFNCDEDYILKGTSIIYCQEDKTWTASVPQCLAPCPDPGHPYQGNRIDNDFRHGQTVNFECPSNYVMNGVRTMKCSNGRWSNAKPSCNAPCDDLAPPVHGWKSGSDFSHGQSVNFYCHFGYTRVGASPITCNDGKWDKQVPICKGKCGRPRTPFRGRLHGNRFIDGDEVTFSCDRGYDLFGNVKLRCNGKTWNSDVPECKARCRFLGRPEHGFYMKGMRNRGDMIQHGVQITYDCLETYTMVGTNMQECDNGRWTNDRPLCKASCRSPGDIARGKKIGRNYGHGKTVRYECDAEYTLEGENILTCVDGKWNDKSPKCRAPCHDPVPPINGKLHGGDFRHNSWVTFSCDRNYQRDGNERIKCNDGTWSGFAPKCFAVCADPGKPTNGKRLNDNFQDGQTVTFKCNANHDLVGNRTIRCNGGVWSSDAPKCKGKCAFSGNPDNGYTTKRILRRGERLPHGSSVEYACHLPYTLTGSNILRCDDGSWNTSVPSCKASCHNPGLIEHGRKTGNDFSNGKIVTYECTALGYSLEGNPRLTCNNGNWDSDRPQCKASCDPLPALSNGKIHNNDINHGTLVSFSCNKGFQRKGVRQIVCIDGTWNGSSPTCEGTCKDPGPVDNGQVSGDDYSYDATIDFRCNWGYDLNGPRSLTCVKGVWNSQIPACKKRCQDPGKPLNGWPLGNNYSHGGTVQFVCKDVTFDLIGASKITCIEGDWSHPIPSCEGRCSDPGRPDNGIKEGDDYRSRANVTFRCNPPLELLGSDVILCQDGKWSASRPTCTSCARPLGLEKNQDIRITSPAHLHFNYRPSSARLNGPFAWCSSKQTYLQIDLAKAYKLTAIATQGETGLDKWVKRYRISFKTGPTNVAYSESGSTKDIDGNKDASSIVEYKFKEPFITSTVWIHPLFVGTDPICLRTELYGCDPTPECVLVGSMFWGFWADNLGALNYYKAYITKLNDTHVDFVLQVNKEYVRSYRKTDPVLIIDDTISEIKNVAVNATVIAQHKSDKPEWYRTGTVMSTSGTSFARVKFDDGKTKFVRLQNLRLVKRPRFCVDNI